MNSALGQAIALEACYQTWHAYKETRRHFAEAVGDNLEGWTEIELDMEAQSALG